MPKTTTTTTPKSTKNDDMILKKVSKNLLRNERILCYSSRALALLKKFHLVNLLFPLPLCRCGDCRLLTTRSILDSSAGRRRLRLLVDELGYRCCRYATSFRSRRAFVGGAVAILVCTLWSTIHRRNSIVLANETVNSSEGRLN